MDPTDLRCSAVLRSNTTMLFTVFGAAFGMQLYVIRTPEELRKDGILNRMTAASTRAQTRSGTLSTAA
jgi:hypothetical protein